MLISGKFPPLIDGFTLCLDLPFQSVFTRLIDLTGEDRKSSKGRQWGAMWRKLVKKNVEEALRSKMKAKALMECDQFVSKYAQCATGRTFSVVWTCRKQAKELNTCLHQFTNDNVLEEMKRDCMLQEEGKVSASAI